MPPYTEQARYIELANRFLEHNGASRPGQADEATTNTGETELPRKKVS